MVDVRQVLPHSGEMVLIDNILSHDENLIVASTRIQEGCPFYRDGTEPMMNGTSGVPSWVGLEYMAQTVAAWNGLRARAKGEGPKSGFLIGAKSYQTNRAVFPLGSELRIEAQLQDHHGSLKVFQCQITAEDTEIQAVLSVFEGDPPA